MYGVSGYLHIRVGQSHTCGCDGDVADVRPLLLQPEPVASGLSCPLPDGAHVHALVGGHGASQHQSIGALAVQVQPEAAVGVPLGRRVRHRHRAVRPERQQVLQVGHSFSGRPGDGQLGAQGVIPGGVAEEVHGATLGDDRCRGAGLHHKAVRDDCGQGRRGGTWSYYKPASTRHNIQYTSQIDFK